MITRESHIQSLVALRDLALAARKIPAAVQCEIALGRVAGFQKGMDEDGQAKSIYQMIDDELMQIAMGKREG